MENSILDPSRISTLSYLTFDNFRFISDVLIGIISVFSSIFSTSLIDDLTFLANKALNLVLSYLKIDLPFDLGCSSLSTIKLIRFLSTNY